MLSLTTILVLCVMAYCVPQLSTLINTSILTYFVTITFCAPTLIDRRHTQRKIASATCFLLSTPLFFAPTLSFGTFSKLSPPRSSPFANLYDGLPFHADVNSKPTAVRAQIHRRFRTLPDLIGGHTVLALNARIETVKDELEVRMEDIEENMFRLQRVTGLRRRPFPDDGAEEEDRQ